MGAILYWGPSFPDAERRYYTVPAASQILELTNVTEPDGPLDFAYLRARTAGVTGNTITVQFSGDALTESGDFIEDTGSDPKTIHVKFVPGGTTVDDLAALLAGSTLVELAGIWQTNDALRENPQDEFSPTAMYGGADAYQTWTTGWGPMFPDSPDAAPPIPATPPLAEATLALQLEVGATVTYEWTGSVTKTYDGREQRSRAVDDPRARYAGSAYLLGQQTAIARDRLRKLAASGATFALALPHEEATLAGPNVGVVVSAYAGAMALADWSNPGQTVAIMATDGAAEEFVIQSVAGDDVELDREPLITVEAGARLIPTVPVLLDARQGFRRFPADSDGTAVDEWQLEAVGASLGFPHPAVPARLALGPLAPALDGAEIIAVLPGTAGNAIQVQSIFAGVGTIVVIDDGFDPVTVLYGAHTAGEWVDAVNAGAARVRCTDPDDPDAPLTTPPDEFDPTNLSGGTDELPGTFGRGVTLTTWEDDRPVWDRGIDVEDAAGDSEHAMTEMLDLGARPSVFGTALRPDWGRQLRRRGEGSEELQHAKAFLAACRGRAKSFYLPTHRPDLLAVGGGPGGSGVGSILVDASYSDVFAWWPVFAGASLIWLEQGEDSHLLEIVDAVDMLDGTVRLDVRAAGDGPLPTTDAIDRISWVDLCRLERAEAEFSWEGAVFELDLLARAVYQNPT